jgi:hypothetical protein
MKGLIARKIGEKRKVFKFFLRFLKEKGLYYEFFKIMKSCPPGEYKNTYKGNLIYFFCNCEPEYWTTSCFTWASYNKPGVNWGKIHREWCMEYRVYLD